MGWLGWLLGAALAIGGAILISEVISGIINKQSLISWLRQKRSAGQIPYASKVLLKNKSDHAVDASLLDDSNRDLGTVRASSNYGVSNELQNGTIVYLD